MKIWFLYLYRKYNTEYVRQLHTSHKINEKYVSICTLNNLRVLLILFVQEYRKKITVRRDLELPSLSSGLRPIASRAQICKGLRSPEIDSKKSNLSSNVT